MIINISLYSSCIKYMYIMLNSSGRNRNLRKGFFGHVKSREQTLNVFLIFDPSTRSDRYKGREFNYLKYSVLEKFD